MIQYLKVAALVLGELATVLGAVGVAWADPADDTTCYLKGFKNVGGNWIGSPTSANCNTPDCPIGQGGPGACQLRSGGASGQHPGYNTQWCKCAPGGGVWCELVYYYKDEATTDFFYACPTVPCTAPNHCELEGSGTGPYTCKCK